MEVAAIELIAVGKLESSNSDPKVQKVTQQSQNRQTAQIITAQSQFDLLRQNNPIKNKL